MKARNCFECGKQLDWFDFKLQNFHLSHDYLIKLWNHDAIQLYCCECFKQEMSLNSGIVYFPHKSKKKKENFEVNNLEFLKE